MTFEEFRERWEPLVPPDARTQFVAEIVTLLRLEASKERRRLCTDAVLYQQACEETLAEIRRQAA